MTYKVVEKLKDPEYRKAFVAAQINVAIPFQIRALLRSRPGWTQATLAEKTGMRQPSISGLLTPGKTRPNIETLRRIAEAFDCGLMVRFAPFSELAKWSETFDPETFNVPSFDNDPGFVDDKPQGIAAYGVPKAAQVLQQEHGIKDNLFFIEKLPPQTLTAQTSPMLVGCSSASR
jgi:transcriptional regulator with XRE-family HTH domain